MSRHSYGSRRDPLLIQFDRHSQMSSLHEAKLAAWAFAIGEHAPSGEPPGGRRVHRGLLPDVGPPEPPYHEARPSLPKRIAAGLVRLLRFGQAGEFGQTGEALASALARDASTAIGEGADILYIDWNKAAESATATEGGDRQAIRTRVA